HRAGALHDLRQEHLSVAEEVAHHLHPRHQRPLDDVERPVGTLPRLLGVLLDEVDDAVHERVLEPLLDRRLAPGEVDLPFRRRAPVTAATRGGAAARRSKMTSSTSSSSSGSMSSYTTSWPAFTMPMSRPARIAW